MFSLIQNHNMCVSSDFLCVAGRLCDVPVDLCSSAPCQNSGTCVNVGGTSYHCVCAGGYRGSNCEEEEQSECLAQNTGCP